MDVICIAGTEYRIEREVWPRHVRPSYGASMRRDMARAGVSHFLELTDESGQRWCVPVERDGGIDPERVTRVVKTNAPRHR